MGRPKSALAEDSQRLPEAARWVALAELPLSLVAAAVVQLKMGWVQTLNSGAAGLKLGAKLLL